MISMAGVTAFAALVLSLVLLTPETLEAQRRPQPERDRAAPRIQASSTDRPGSQADTSIDVTFSIEDRRAIEEYYTSLPSAPALEALPPGIRKNLARGKPLPPGIARKTAPQDLVSRLSVPSGYDVVEVGLDVFLVEAATGIIRDGLMDVIR
ncbi:MAG: anti-virulence regulator CigR family protein [Longimicrobiales bacterium]